MYHRSSTYYVRLQPPTTNAMLREHCLIVAGPLQSHTDVGLSNLMVRRLRQCSPHGGAAYHAQTAVSHRRWTSPPRCMNLTCRRCRPTAGRQRRRGWRTAGRRWACAAAQRRLPALVAAVSASQCTMVCLYNGLPLPLPLQQLLQDVNSLRSYTPAAESGTMGGGALR